MLPLLILSLPLADMSAVIMGRVSDGRSPFYPDRRHLHHRLLRAGYSHRRTVLLIYAFTQWLAALALVAANAEMRFLWLGLATAVLVMGGGAAAAIPAAMPSVWPIRLHKSRARALLQNSSNGDLELTPQRLRDPLHRHRTAAWQHPQWQCPLAR